MIKLLTIIGARPQIIKAAALSRAIKMGFKDQVNEIILHTGQHYDDSMSDIFFREMQIPQPDYNLKIGSASHGSQTGQMIEGIEKVILKEQPQGLVVYGDTNSTVTGIKNLEQEGIVHHENQALSFDNQGVYHNGDIMYDNTLFFKALAINKSPILKNIGLENKDYILATIHRPSNTDIPENLASIVRALDQITREKEIVLILPLHPRTLAILKRDESTESLELIQSNKLIRLIPAVSFLDMIRLEAGAKVLLTDSGGVQKEAWFMEKPVVVLREQTEWVEIIEAGNGVLTGPDQEKIVSATRLYLDSPPSSYPPIFGDGKAAFRILEILTQAPWQQSY